MGYTDKVSRTGAQPLIPEEVVAQIFEALPQQSIVMQMGQRLPDISRNQTRMKVQSLLPEAYFVSGDTGLKQTTSIAWANKYLNVEEIAVILPIPEAVLDDTDISIWNAARPKIAEAFGKRFDSAVLRGVSAPASWPTNILAGAVAAGHGVQKSLFADVYDAIFATGGMKNLVAKDGYPVTGYVGDIEMEALLEGLRDANGQPIYKQSLQENTPAALGGRRIEYPMNGSMDPLEALLFAGDWRQLVWAMRKDLTMTLSNDGVITNDAGEIVYNFFQQDMVGMRFVMRIAWQLPNPVNRMNQIDATRYPFSVLLPS